MAAEYLVKTVDGNSADDTGNAMSSGGSAPSLTSTQIGVGNGSNLLSGSDGLTFDDPTFTVGHPSARGLLINGTQDMQIGDLDGNWDGLKQEIDPTNSKVIFDNSTHTALIGINTNPTVALDVVGI